MTFSGSIADLNAALDGMTFTPSGNFNGTAALTVMTTDGVDSDSDNVNITVNAVNDNPVNSVPATQTTDEDTAIELSTTNGNAISVSDVDAGAATIQVNLNAQVDGAPDGTITLDGASGLTFTSGDGTADPTVTFQGTIANINAALDGMSFTPKKDVFGTGEGQIVMNTSDLGNSGSGGTKVDNGDLLLFDVDRIDDDPPIPSLTPGVGTYRNLSKTLSFADRNQIKVEDPDFPNAGTTTVEVALESTHGTMTLASTAGLTITSGANGSSAMTLQGLQSDINGALDGGLTFGVEPGFTGQATIEVTTDDLTALDPAPQANDTFEIEVDQPEEAAYWVASKETVPPIRNAALARAELDGGGGADLVTGPELFDTPSATAIDSVEGRIYWMNTGAFNPTQDGIWSANLDGTDKQLFLSDSDTPPVGLKPPPAGVHLNAGQRHGDRPGNPPDLLGQHRDLRHLLGEPGRHRHRRTGQHGRRDRIDAGRARARPRERPGHLDQRRRPEHESSHLVRPAAADRGNPGQLRELQHHRCRRELELRRELTERRSRGPFERS